MNRTIMRISILLLALGFGLVQLICGQEDRSALKAQEILQEVDVSGGLIVHLGCGDGMLTAGFGADDAYLVHGLDAKVERVAEARGYILPSPWLSRTDVSSTRPPRRRESSTSPPKTVRYFVWVSCK